MKKEYDFSKLRKRAKPSQSISGEEAKLPISIRLDGSDVAHFKTEAHRLGIPYQTLISSVLHRFVRGELIDRKVLEDAISIREMLKEKEGKK